MPASNHIGGGSMPLIQNSVAVLANATNANVIAGSPYEFLPFDAYVEIGLVGSATGLVATVTSGTDQLMGPDAALSLQNRFPIYPDDYSLTDQALAGDRIVIQVRNTTGGNLTLFYALKITPI